MFFKILLVSFSLFRLGIARAPNVPPTAIKLLLISLLSYYYYISSLLNKEKNSSLFIKYYLGLYLIKDIPLVLNISIPSKVSLLLIS